MPQPPIRIYGARQHNLKNLDVEIRTGEMTVVTGVSGSGKSTLVFDTLYAEGQRRYVETFSAYARQFLERMDRPAVDRVEGVPPAIAIEQSNSVRSSRSTVGTMTELNDHLKLLFARAAQLFDRQTAQWVRHDTPDTIEAALRQRCASLGDPRIVISFAVALPAATTVDEVQQWLSSSGFSRIQAQREQGEHTLLDVVADRFRIGHVKRARVMEAIEVALKHGGGRLAVHLLHDNGQTDEAGSPELWHFSTRLHCPASELHYSHPTPSLFSFNSAVGACETCRGFGRVIGIDWSLVIPDEKRTLRAGAIKTIQTPAWQECQDDLMRHAEAAGIARDTPWCRMSAAQQQWVIEGAPDFQEGKGGSWKHQWYGIRRFFTYLESKAYKMHIRVLLSKYRSYTPCPACGGARLQSESLLWRVGSKSDADAVLAPGQRCMPTGVQWSRAQLEALPGLSLHDLMLLPIERLRHFFAHMALSPQAADAAIGASTGGQAQALELLYREITTRLNYLCDAGIGYLTLDRQSRTLSGGEVQRINLTTALGTALVNTLFVLDEPSIGLHPRDMHRVVQVMQRLRDAGNTLVVVEHDPQAMVAADRVLEIGPGPGERGGQIVFDGTPAELRLSDTLTGQYLSARLTVQAPRALPVSTSTPRLLLEGVCAHNLKNVDVSLPLGRMVCVTGVSGSGKSTLVRDVLYPAMLKQQGKPAEVPGRYARLLGAEQLDQVVLVDQTPIGKTARSNPASYVKAFDPIRKLFAAADLARERGYTAGTFSFNSGDGRCPTCAGTGFEHVEMQFLSDVYLRCPDCDGKRFRPEILEVRVEHLGRSASIDEVLDMTVSEALDFFRGLREVQHALAPLADVGLEYVKLGQPVPTLSGGEAQRLKLAGHLAQAARSGISTARVAKKGSLFLFDEPTTGLHFDDIARLMRAFRKLLAAGHTLLIIEHNLDVIRAADWLIDLGPEGGDAGGEVLAACTPQELMAIAASHTGAALRDYEQSVLGAGQVGYAAALPHRPLAVAEPRPDYLRDAQAEKGTPLQSHLLARRHKMQWSAQPPASSPAPAPMSTPVRSMDIIHAREHNLKNISVSIPHDTFTVITGISGSGKSTLAFDILFNEGQRRYLESLNAYARAIVQPAGKPDVDAIYGITPTVAIEQRTSRGGHKSTVATLTEIHHFLRLLYVKLGTQHCPDCGIAVVPQTPEQIVAQLLREHAGRHIGLLAPLVVARKGYYTDLAKWAAGKGVSHLRVDGQFVTTAAWPRLDRYKEHTIELPVMDLLVAQDAQAALRDAVQQTLEHGKGSMRVLMDLTTDTARRWQKGASKSSRYRPRNPCIFPSNAPARAAGRAFPNPTRGCFRTTPNMAGAPAVLVLACNCRALTPRRPVKKTLGTRATKARPRPAACATANA